MGSTSDSSQYSGSEYDFTRISSAVSRDLLVIAAGAGVAKVGSVYIVKSVSYVAPKVVPASLAAGEYLIATTVAGVWWTYDASVFVSKKAVYYATVYNRECESIFYGATSPLPPGNFWEGVGYYSVEAGLTMYDKVSEDINQLFFSQKSMDESCD